MWFGIVWRVVALMLVVAIEFELFSAGRALMNMPFDSTFFGGSALIVISLFAAAWLVLQIFTPRGGAFNEKS